MAFGASNFLIPSMLGITAALFGVKKIIEKGESFHADSH